jgi:hypothetical protein
MDAHANEIPQFVKRLFFPCLPVTLGHRVTGHTLTTEHLCRFGYFVAG